MITHKVLEKYGFMPNNATDNGKPFYYGYYKDLPSDTIREKYEIELLNNEKDGLKLEEINGFFVLDGTTLAIRTEEQLKALWFAVTGRELKPKQS